MENERRRGGARGRQTEGHTMGGMLVKGDSILAHRAVAWLAVRFERAMVGGAIVVRERSCRPFDVNVTSVALVLSAWATRSWRRGDQIVHRFSTGGHRERDSWGPSLKFISLS